MSDSDGTLVFPLEPALSDTDDHALSLPDDDEPALEVSIDLERIGEDGAAQDRWRIYHGTPPVSHWARGTITLGRFRGVIIDGDRLARPNGLAEHEPGLCRLLNTTHLEALRGLVATRLNIDAAQARVVGIDPLGIDVRNTFDVVRLEFDGELDGETAPAAILTMLGV